MSFPTSLEELKFSGNYKIYLAGTYAIFYNFHNTNIRVPEKHPNVAKVTQTPGR